jgi:hypothetical protein
MDRQTMTRPEAAAVARAARTRGKHLRWAAEMRAAGWKVSQPGGRDLLAELIDTADPRAIAGVLRETGNEKYGAHEMDEIADLIDR